MCVHSVPLLFQNARIGLVGRGFNRDTNKQSNQGFNPCSHPAIQSSCTDLHNFHNLSRPGPQHEIFRHRCPRGMLRTNQLPAQKNSQRRLHGAFRKPGPLGNLLQAKLCAASARGICQRVQRKIHKKRGRTAVVADQIAQQHVHNIAFQLERQRKFCSHIPINTTLVITVASEMGLSSVCEAATIRLNSDVNLSRPKGDKHDSRN